MSKKTNKQIEQISSYYHEEDTISLMDILLTVAHQIKVIVIVPILFCIAMIIYVTIFATPIYVSTSKIMSSSGGNISQASGIAAQFGINIPTSQSETKWFYPDVVKSRTLAKAVLKEKFDTNEFGLQKSLFEILNNGKKESDRNYRVMESQAVNKLLGMINISENIKTGILTLTVSAKEPKLAANVNQVIIEKLDSHQRNYNQEKTSETKQFIQDRIINTEKELVAAEEALKVFLDRNRQIQNSPTLQLEQQRLNREVTVLTGVFTTLKSQFETTKIEELKDSDYVVILDSPLIPLERSRPQKKLMVILAGVFGIAFGLVVTIINEYIRNSDKEEKDKMKKAKALIVKNISELFVGKIK